MSRWVCASSCRLTVCWSPKAAFSNAPTCSACATRMCTLSSWGRHSCAPPIRGLRCPVVRVTPAGADNRLHEPLAQVFAGVAPSWRDVTDAFLSSPPGRELLRFVDQRVGDGAVVYPGSVFRALALTHPASTRVVILGRDPYHGPGQAQGLAFSVGGGHKLPPSLRNMLREVHDDTGMPSSTGGELSTWATQGVLLLNSALTVEEGRPQSHAGRGWEQLTDALLARVAAQSRAGRFFVVGCGGATQACAARARAASRADGQSPLAAVGAPRPRPVHRLPAFQPDQPVAGATRSRDVAHSLVERALNCRRYGEPQTTQPNIVTPQGVVGRVDRPSATTAANRAHRRVSRCQRRRLAIRTNPCCCRAR